MQLNPKWCAVTKGSEKLQFFQGIQGSFDDWKIKVIKNYASWFYSWRLSLISMNFIHTQQLWKKLQNTIKWDTDTKMHLILCYCWKRYWGKRSHGIIYLQLLALFFQTQNDNSAEKEECHEDPECSLTPDTAVNSIISYNCGFCAFIQRVEWQLFSLLSLCLQASENDSSSNHSQSEDRWDRTGH